MTDMKPLDTPEFHRLDGCVQGMSGLISQGEYDWHFDVKGFSGSNFTAEDAIKSAYPELEADVLTFTECSPEEMVDEINRQISEERPMWGDPTRTAPVPRPPQPITPIFIPMSFPPDA